MTLANAPRADRTSEDVHRILFLKNRNIFAKGAGQRTGQTTEVICPSGKSDDPLQQIELYCILSATKMPLPRGQALRRQMRIAVPSQRQLAFGFPEQLLLVMLVVAPNHEQNDDRRVERHPSERYGNAMEALAQQIATGTERSGPRDSAQHVENEKPQRRVPIDTGQQGSEYAKQRDEASPKNDFAAV